MPAPDAPRVMAHHHRHGHAHFWERAMSRRQVMRGAAGLTLAGIGAGRLSVARAQDAGAAPKPIPGGIDLGDGNLIHVYDYSQGWDPATITDFRGLVGIHHLRGWGTVSTGGGGGRLSTPTAIGDRLEFDADMRFMQGTYIGEDGQTRQGTFGFV